MSRHNHAIDVLGARHPLTDCVIGVQAGARVSRSQSTIDAYAAQGVIVPPMTGTVRSCNGGFVDVDWDGESRTERGIYEKDLVIVGGFFSDLFATSKSKFYGEWNKYGSYVDGDVVSYQGKYYAAVDYINPPTAGMESFFATYKTPGACDSWREVAKPADLVGTWGDDTTDYDFGVSKVVGLVQFFNDLGRPLEFEADVERVYREYEANKVIDFGANKLGKWLNATGMKQVGADAAIVTDAIRASGAHRGSGTASASKLIPTVMENPVYKPGKDDGTQSWWDKIPTWGYAVGGVVLAGGLIAVVAPVVTPMIVARIGRR